MPVEQPDHIASAPRVSCISRLGRIILGHWQPAGPRCQTTVVKNKTKSGHAGTGFFQTHRSYIPKLKPDEGLQVWTTERPILFLVLLVIAIIFFWGIFGASVFVAYKQKHAIEKIGQFGDSFGILNALFSGIAFAAIVIALLLQHADLKATLREVHDGNLTAQRQHAENAEAIARLFHSTDMIEARKNAYAARLRWMKEKDFRSTFAAHWVDVESDPGLVQAAQQHADLTWPTSRLIEYYCNMYYHLKALTPTFDKPNTLAEILTRRYLWPYWRGYLLTLGNEVSQRYKSRIPANEQNQYPIGSWVQDLRELDKLSKLEAYDPQLHPIDKAHWKDFTFTVEDRPDAEAARS